MRVVLFLLLLTALVRACAQLSEDFSDGDFTADPVWVGDTTWFVVEDGWLRSRGPEASSTLYLSTAQALLGETEWRFSIRLDFDPSSTNYARVYLVSDQEDLRGPVEGYYLQVGQSGATLSDTLALYRSDGSSSTLLLMGSEPCIRSASSNLMDVRVLRSPGGHWELWADCEQRGYPLLMGTASDTTYNLSRFFGVLVRYTTASRSDKYFLDAIYAGIPVPDTVAPLLERIALEGDSSLALHFSEPLEGFSASDPFNYRLFPAGISPVQALWQPDSPRQVELVFGSELPNGDTAWLHVDGVSDPAGNAMVPDSFAVFRYRPGKWDVLIAEFMADESPWGGMLPACEYVELYNRSPFALELEGWTLSDDPEAEGTALPPFRLEPGAHLVLCPQAEEAAFRALGDALGLSSWPSLNNSGDAIVLRDPQGALVHQIRYNLDWYRHAGKSEGGWSVEMIDTQRPWLGSCNWRASEATAQGTPGQPNAVAMEDTLAPALIGLALTDSSTLRLLYSEPMDSISLVRSGDFAVSPHPGNWLSSIPLGPDFDALDLRSERAWLPATVYRMQRAAGRDCAGNALQSGTDTLRFGVPEAPDSLDVVINEILYDPKTGGADFVELYNRSQKIVDLSRMFIAEVDWMAPGEKLEVAQVSAQGRLLFPGEHLALTADPAAVRQQFPAAPPAGLQAVAGMPSWPDSDKEGVVLLEYRQLAELRSLDRVHYHQDWHFALLDDREGVSLERLSPQGPSQEASNWHSAARSAGWASPGQPNSMRMVQAGASAGHLSLYPDIFSPDQDGRDDLLFIRWTLDGPGYLLSLTVFDARGRPVRHLLRQESAAPEGQWIWDGLNDRLERAAVGQYIVWMEAFDLAGRRVQEKQVCVLAGQLR